MSVLQMSQQKKPQQTSTPLLASVDLQSQFNQQQQFNCQIIDQISSLFEVFATYFDKRFFELSEFLYHFNKSVLTTNKNFSNLASSSSTRQQIDQILPFKQRKEERRLSDELRDNIKKMYTIRDDIMRRSQSGINSISMNESLKDPKVLKNLNNQMSSHSFQRGSTSSSETDPKRQKAKQRSPGEINSPSSPSQELPKGKSPQKKKKPQPKEECEVQEGDEGDLKKQLLMDSLVGIQLKRPATTLGNMATCPDEDTEGESVLIGEEEPMFMTKKNSQSLSKKSQTSKSPKRQTKLLQHNKHRVKKSPVNTSNTSKVSRQIGTPEAKAKLQTVSETETSSNLAITKTPDRLNKSPFSYAQKSITSLSKYQQLHQQKSPKTSIMNSAQQFSKTMINQKQPNISNNKPKSTRQHLLHTTNFQSTSQAMRNKFITKSKSPPRPNHNETQKIVSRSSKQNSIQTGLNSQAVPQTLNDQNQKTSNFQQNNVNKAISKSSPSNLSNDIQSFSPLLSSSGGSSSKHHFDSLQPVRKSAQQAVNTRYATITERQSPMLSHQSSTVSDEEKAFDQQTKANIFKRDSILHMHDDIESEDGGRSIFEKNLEDLNNSGGVTGETSLNQNLAHRFTLQGEGGCKEELKDEKTNNGEQYSLSDFADKPMKQMAGNNSKKRQSHPKMLDSKVQILSTENIFSPTAAMGEFDLAQYNSPSFAAGGHISINYNSKSRQNEPGHRAVPSISSAKDSDSMSHPLNYEQKIIMHNSVQAKANKSVFLKMPGEVLTLLGEYLNEKLPIFIFTNRISFKVSLQYQIEHYEQQRQIMLGQSHSIHRELERMQNASAFDLSYQSREEFESLEYEEWQGLISACKAHSEGKPHVLKQKDIIILRLYLTFMGLELADEEEDSKFLAQTTEFMNDCGGQVRDLMDPERCFLITDENKKRIKELLVNLQKEKLLEEDNKTEEGESQEKESSAGKVIETFTNLLFEALQFVNIIPNVLASDMKSEMEELRKVGEAFNGIKNNLIDFKNLAA